PVVLACGETVESVFTADQQVHRYVINAQSDMALIIYAEAQIGNYERLAIDVGLWAPNSFEINRLNWGDRAQTNTVTTGWLSVDGRYDISIQGWTDTGGSYSLTTSCLYDDGTVVSGNNLVQSLQCGSIVENVISRDAEMHRYYIVLNRNDQVKLSASSLTGNYEVLYMDMEIGRAHV